MIERYRLGWLVNPLARATNMQVLQFGRIPDRKRLRDFGADAVFICAMTPACLLMGYRIARSLELPWLIYFMDDWIAAEDTRWLGGSVQAVSRRLLQGAAGLACVSKRMINALLERYDASPARTAVIHNPVEVPPGENSPTYQARTGPFLIRYAGAIWPSHVDALEAVTDAVSQLHVEGHEVELRIHTPAEFSEHYAPKLSGPGISFEPFIPYERMNEELTNADLLLIALSFEAAKVPIVKASVPTKLTDYMAVGRPILSVAPRYSACNDLIRKWKCGLTCETNEVVEIKSFLVRQLENRSQNQALAVRALQVLRERFAKERVIPQFHDFIREVVGRRSDYL